ncbi:hypothetical protein CDL15_Pgr006181 [Punica granatum]|uniref:Thaumatin-like protein n=1 Tax=Punica granatum TaxID=22663 RepID=A0A218VTX9_PUNGR|nr:hypothetical protein CDL15_Pgr006181 [Punica granatum]
MSLFTNSYASFFLVSIILLNSANAAQFGVTNNCPYTVWAAAVPGGGRRLNHGETWALDVPAGTNRGRIWARTSCQFDASGMGKCMTGDYRCNRVIRCTADIIGQCPEELKAPGGCNDACSVFKTDEYCCNSSGSCGPTDYSRFFKDRCPDAYSYPRDDATSTFTCPGGTNYKVVFCP